MVAYHKKCAPRWSALLNESRLSSPRRAHPTCRNWHLGPGSLQVAFPPALVRGSIISRPWNFVKTFEQNMNISLPVPPSPDGRSRGRKRKISTRSRHHQGFSVHDLLAGRPACCGQIAIHRRSINTANVPVIRRQEVDKGGVIHGWLCGALPADFNTQPASCLTRPVDDPDGQGTGGLGIYRVQRPGVQGARGASGLPRPRDVPWPGLWFVSAGAPPQGVVVEDGAQIQGYTTGRVPNS